MQFPITIGLRRSRFLDAGILWVALLATLAVVYWPQRSAALHGAIIAALWGIAILAWFRTSPALQMIRLERDGRILAAGTDHGEFFPLFLLPGAAIHHWLSVVRLKNGAGQVFTLIATVDNMNRDDFRRLRLFLRWRADFSGEGDVV